MTTVQRSTKGNWKFWTSKFCPSDLTPEKYFPGALRVQKEREKRANLSFDFLTRCSETKRKTRHEKYMQIATEIQAERNIYDRSTCSHSR